MEAAVSTATFVSRKPRTRDKHSRYCRTFPRFGICCSHVPSCLRRYSEVHGAPFVVVEKNVTNMSTAEHRFVDVLDETVIVRRRAATVLASDDTASVVFHFGSHCGRGALASSVRESQSVVVLAAVSLKKLVRIRIHRLRQMLRLFCRGLFERFALLRCNPVCLCIKTLSAFDMSESVSLLDCSVTTT